MFRVRNPGAGAVRSAGDRRRRKETVMHEAARILLQGGQRASRDWMAFTAARATAEHAAPSRLIGAE